MVRCVPGARERGDHYRRSQGGGGRRDDSPTFTTRPRPAFLFLLLPLLLPASPVAPADDTIARSFCDAPPHDQVYPVLPKDNTDFDANFSFLLSKAR